MAIVLKNEDELIEGYLWDEHCSPPIDVRREGRDFNTTQQELDGATRSHGHICSDQCPTWAVTLALATPIGVGNGFSGSSNHGSGSPRAAFRGRLFL